MPLIAVEVLLGCVPVGWGVWELMSLRREKRRDAEKASGADAAMVAGAAPSSAGSGADQAGAGPPA